LRWDDFDPAGRTLRIDEGLVAVRRGAAWTNAKNERSRRVIPLDADTSAVLVRHRWLQAEERLAAGCAWEDNALRSLPLFGCLRGNIAGSEEGTPLARALNAGNRRRSG
jgi:hypothetical protein